MAPGSGKEHLNGGVGGASDESLAAQASALADTAAFETLIHRHQQRILYLHRRFTRDPALAEELSQETFLRAWRKLGSFQGSGAFAGWLNRLAYNVYLQHRRRNLRHAAVESLDGMAPAAAEAALTVADTGSLAPELDRLLAVVSRDEQELLVLSYAGGLSAAEIGDMLGLAAGTVKSLIHRAKHKIRRHFQIEVER